MKAIHLMCNNFSNPIQVEENPVFSWNIPCDRNGAGQTAYRIQVYCGKEKCWDTGRTEGGSCLFIPYDGRTLIPDSQYSWRVKYWNERGEEAEWSEPAFFETGLMENGWKAEWIGYDRIEGEAYNPAITFYCADDFDKGINQYYLPPAPYMRKEFIVKEGLRSAKLYISALGLTEIEINGNKAGDEVFIPGLSDYDRTVYSRAFHVEDFLNEGSNAIGIILADGWYAGYIGLNAREWYGSRPRVILQLEMEYQDGAREQIMSDASWKASYGPLQESDIFQGETYNALKELGKWSSPGYQDERWEAVDTGTEKRLIPKGHTGVAMKERESLRPAKIIRKRENCYLIDFGEYLAGIMEISCTGEAGASFSVKHAETLDKNGELYLRGNRSARCMDSYILKGAQTEYFKPRFTYHGFRYAEICGKGKISFLDIKALKIGSELPDKTEFSCSSELVNQIFEMIRSTEECNMMDVPTDCCARDERLGWGMEGNHFMHAMAYMNNQSAAISKWVKDIWDGQREDGGLEAIAPPMRMKDIEQFVGDLQSNHGVHMVYVLYHMYGDTHVIRKYFNQMNRYFDFLERNSDRYIRNATGGDWLAILEETNHSDFLHGFGDSSPGMIGTSHYAIITQMMAEMCHAIGKQADEQRYLKLLGNIKNAFRLNYIQRDGTLRNGRQGEYLMALYCGFFTEEEEKKALIVLEKKLMEKGHIQWKGGTATTPYFLTAMKRFGKEKLANLFLTSDQYPGLGYMLHCGYHTIWERWDAVFEDGTLHPQAMNALCHIGFTVVAQYLIGGLAGIDCLEAGFRKIIISPGPSEEIRSACAQLFSNYGVIKSAWIWENGILHVKCSIPANTKAIIVLPRNQTEELLWLEGESMGTVYNNNKVFAEISSGKYEMEIRWDGDNHMSVRERS